MRSKPTASGSGWIREQFTSHWLTDPNIGWLWE